MGGNTYATRKKLPHELPPWVEPGSRYFITVNCRRRGNNQLCRDRVAEELLQSVGVYERLRRWYVWLMLVMPDHVHIIAAFDRARGIQRIMSAWKGYQAKQLAIDWQADFFEHRLRNDAEFVEKAYYVRKNPVRRGLVADPSAWPYLWERA